MDVIAIPLFALMDANLMALALVLVLAILAGVAMGLVIWGLVLEARSNREWRERLVAQ